MQDFNDTFFTEEPLVDPMLAHWEHVRAGMLKPDAHEHDEIIVANGYLVCKARALIADDEPFVAFFSAATTGMYLSVMDQRRKNEILPHMDFALRAGRSVVHSTSTWSKEANRERLDINQQRPLATP